VVGRTGSNVLNDAIYINGNGTVVQGNFIGTDKSGTLPLRRGTVVIDANNTLIGGVAPGAGNTIAFNADPGVDVDSGTGNSILGNSIYANASPGIYLNSANSANDKQAAPVLASVSTSTSGTTVSGTLQSVASSTTFRIEFFANAAMDPSGDGQGQTYIGYAKVTTDANGYLVSSPDGSAVITNPDTANATFTAMLNTVVPRGYFISATATNLSTGDTSQFAKDLVVGSFLVTNTSDSGPGSLPAAITDANTLGYGTAANPDLIAFDITSASDAAGSGTGFNAATGVATIQPHSALPTLNDTVVIDGYTQPGASPNTLAVGDNAVLKIVLDGSLAGVVDGLTITGGNSTVRGLVIDNFASASGLVVFGGGNDVVAGNFIGTDVSGTVARGNYQAGVVVESANNVIGGLTPAARNLVSGNGPSPSQFLGTGIEIADATATGNVVEGNYVGTDATGTQRLGNQWGVYISYGASNNTVGGTTTSARNVISANAWDGVVLGYPDRVGDGTGNVIEGNFIGTDVTGTMALGNGRIGITVNSEDPDTTIGGASDLSGGQLAGAGNLISGNSPGSGNGAGIALAAEGCQVFGNFIGTDVTGTVALPNFLGLRVGGPNATLGGHNGLGNLISGNTHGGLLFDSTATGLVMQGNLVGTDATGGADGRTLGDSSMEASPNQMTIGGTAAGDGNVFAAGNVLIDGSPQNLVFEGNSVGTDRTGTIALGGNLVVDVDNSVTIGGSAAGAGNVIAYSGGDGIVIGRGSNTGSVTITGNSIYGNLDSGVFVNSGRGNTIRGNSIYGDGGLGIRFNGQKNANDNQAFPVFTGFATSGTTLTVSGTLQSVPSTTFDIDLYANAAPNPTGFGEGQTFLGVSEVVTDAGGFASFTASVPAPAVGQRFISATATNLATGDTSQFAKAFVILPQISIVTNTGDNGGVNPIPSAGTGTLRQAIVDANADINATPTHPHIIEFDIPATDPNHFYYQGSIGNVAVTTATDDSTLSDISQAWSHSWWSIAPLAPLPPNTAPVTIDGYSQPGAQPNSLAEGDNAILRIELNGINAGSSLNGASLLISGGYSTVEGLAINRFVNVNSPDGLDIGTSVGGNPVADPGHDSVVGNFIGTDVSGTEALGNYRAGILIESPNNTVGGTTPADRNVISGNGPASNQYNGTGVWISTAFSTGNVVEGNFIGTDRTGTAPLANQWGVTVGNGADDNTIGGTTPGAGNIISGNAFDGVTIGFGGAGVTGNLVEGDFVGTDVSGTYLLPNGRAGVVITGGANGNTVGGVSTLTNGRLAGAGNLIDGASSAGAGVAVTSNQNLIAGNFIGTDVTGTQPLGNYLGVRVSLGSSNMIGGTAAGTGNLISGNEEIGILIGDGSATANLVEGNLIATDITGTQPVGYSSYGVVIGTSGNTVGGTAAGAGNVIAAGTGIVLGASNIVQGNWIGTNPAGSTLPGNPSYGILVEADSSTIGGTAPGAGNIIAYCQKAVDVDSGTGNSILGNSIFANAAGIVLNRANNANDKQEAPVLTSVSTSSSRTTISGTLKKVANATFRIEFFANVAMDPSGDGQGQTYIGYATVTTDANGYLVSSPDGSALITNPDTANATFTATFSTMVPTGYFLSATATNLSTGDTSQFAKDLVVGSFLVTNTSDSGPGSLREAICDANTLAYGTAANPDLIAFDITSASDAAGGGTGFNAATGVATILPHSALPTLNDTVVIDGYTQPVASPNTLAVGDNAVLKIVLDGSQAGAVNGLVIGGGNSTIRGLVINKFANSLLTRGGIVVNGSGNDVITGDFIGTDVSGEYAAANYSGIITNAPNNTIGGTTPAARNIVSGNMYHGVGVYGPNNLVEGNYIGTDATGEIALGNAFLGESDVQIDSNNNTIGGTTAGAGNVISGTPDNGYVNPQEGGNGITIFGNGNLIQGNYIGTDATGTVSLGNYLAGVTVWAGNSNTIGGTSAAARNIISGNGTTGNPVVGGAGAGVLLTHGASGNLVEGDFIGTDVTGTHLLPNAQSGVFITFGSNGNTVGGVSTLGNGRLAGAGNLIDGAGTGGAGVFVNTNQNLVAGNFIGTDVTGTQVLGNYFGVRLGVGGSSNTIGGTAAGMGNLISGNEGGDIVGDGSATAILVEGNLIGTDITGTETLGYSSFGVEIGPGSTIGGTAAGAGNVIAAGTGIVLAPSNVVQGNWIGTNLAGSTRLSAGDGILVEGDSSTIGGTVPGAGNTIANCVNAAVDVDSGTGNSILGNSIFANAAGIVLNSANKANDKQAAPFLTGGSGSSSGTSITGTLASVPNTTFRIEFFANQRLDLSLNAEGQTFLGYTTVATDNSGNATFTASNLAAIPAGEGYVTATATVATLNPDDTYTYGDSSPFSNYLAVPTSMQLTASANPAFFGLPVTLTATVSANFSGFGTPVGSVDFVDTTTGTDLGSAPLSGGTATLTTSAMNSGTQVITATYGGNTTFLGSSAMLTLTVAPSILVLNPTASGALSVSGNASISIAGNVVVDSNSTSALTEKGNASITAASIQVVGGDQKTSNATWSPTPVTGAGSVPDPLAGLAAPTGGVAQGSVNLTRGSLTINPGIYTQINVSGKAQLTLNPGVYILAGGGLTVSGNASISGTGVTLYNTESAFPNPGGTYGGITLSGNGTFNLTAPTSGPYAGILLFQARTNTRAIALSGNAAEALSGTIYAPAALLFLSGNASLAGSVVVNELSLAGNAASTQTADGFDVSAGDTAGQLLAGQLEVYVNDPAGLFTADELARIQAAVNALDAEVEPYGVSVAETTDPTVANVVIDTGSTSPVGGYADGVLGCYNPDGEITLIQGWNWYAGADPAAIGAGQFDVQTTVTHELGHALGLGESADPTSAMYGTLAPATAVRTLTTADLNIPYDEEGPDPQRAAFGPGTAPAASGVPAFTAAFGDPAGAGRVEPTRSSTGIDIIALAGANDGQNQRLADALHGTWVAAQAAAQALSASSQATELLTGAAGRFSAAGNGVVIPGAASPPSLDGASPDGDLQRIAPPYGPSAEPAKGGEMSEAALAVFVELGRQRDGYLALGNGGPFALESFGHGKETGEVAWSGLTGAEPVLLALLAATCGASDRESESRKRLPRQDG
jgi:hypothetical protein